MSFLLDTDTCSAYLKSHRQAQSRFMQYAGGLHVSTVTVAELRTWSNRAHISKRLDGSIDDMLAVVGTIPVDDAIATHAGQVRAELMDRGIIISLPDLLIASTALVLNYTLITHNTRHFAVVPALRHLDWLT